MTDQPDLFGHNQPPVTVELTQEQAAALMADLNRCMATLLSVLPTLTSPGGQHKVVESLEAYKVIRNALIKAGVKSE